MTSVAVTDAVARPATRVRTKPAFYVGIAFGWLSPLLVGMLYDWRARGRPHVVYVISAAWLFVGATRVLLTESEGWLRIGRAILAAFV
jgi:hypothetical protein